MVDRVVGYYGLCLLFFFFKQKTAYEMRISDWSSDVCSSDLINMGCPAKKVCNVWAGSALMRDEALVARILSAVVCAVSVPVTLKIRTGWDAHHHNALAIAHIAEDCGIASLALHGRSRHPHYTGWTQYVTNAALKAHMSHPVATT